MTLSLILSKVLDHKNEKKQAFMYPMKYQNTPRSVGLWKQLISIRSVTEIRFENPTSRGSL